MTLQNTLNGVRVLDLSHGLFGRYYSMILANFGAEVAAIDDPEIQEDGQCFNDLNRNEKRISLNLKTPEGLDIFFTLAEKADVVLEELSPDVVQQLGVDYQAVCQCNPRIIYCSISGYRQTDPFHNRFDHDVHYMSNRGGMDLICEKEGGPTIPNLQIADIARDNIVLQILLALFSREKTGKGQYISISRPLKTGG